MTPLQEFKNQFAFQPQPRLLMGVEREAFLRCLRTDSIVPVADQIMRQLALSDYYHQFSPELSACQIEHQSEPLPVDLLEDQLIVLRNELTDATATWGCEPVFSEVGPEDMPIEVFPKDRYRTIKEKLSAEELLAACRVTGTHFHVGLPDHDTALRAYNKAVDHVEEVIRLGDSSNGERMRLYEIVSPDCRPPKLSSWDEFHHLATKGGFATKPRDCWWLARLTAYGTIEFRGFGNTESIDQTMAWAHFCHDLCSSVL